MSSEEITENINEVKEKTILDTTLGLYSVFMGWIYIPIFIFVIISLLLAALCVFMVIGWPLALWIMANVCLILAWYFSITNLAGLLILIVCILKKEINLKSLKFDFKEPFKIFAFSIYWLGFLIYCILAFLFITYYYKKSPSLYACLLNLIFSYLLCRLFFYINYKRKLHEKNVTKRTSKLCEACEPVWKTKFIIKKRSYFLIAICLLVILSIKPVTDYINSHTSHTKIPENFKGFVKVEMPKEYRYYQYYSEKDLYKISENKYLFFGENKRNKSLIGIINTETYKFEKYITEKDYFIKPISQLPDGNIYIMVENDNIKGLHPAVFDVKEFKIKNIDYERNFARYKFLRLDNNNILMYKDFKSVIYDIHTRKYTESFEYPSLKGHDGIALNDDEIFFITKYGTNNDPSREITICSTKNKTCKSHKVEDGQFYFLNLFKNDKGQVLIFNKKVSNGYDISLFEPKDNTLKLISNNPGSTDVFVSELNDGNILITNGKTGEIKIFDITTNNIKTLDMKLTPYMDKHSLIMLDSGKMLVLGGKIEISDWKYTVEIMFL